MAKRWQNIDGVFEYLTGDKRWICRVPGAGRRFMAHQMVPTNYSQALTRQARFMGGWVDADFGIAPPKVKRTRKGTRKSKIRGIILFDFGV